MSSLIEYLESIQTLCARNGQKTIEEIVLRHGKPYQPPKFPRPQGIRKGRQGYCYMNSYHLAVARNCTYVEGFAIAFREIPIPLQHAWVVDQEGNVIETTWEAPACEYYGIPLELSFVHQVMYEIKVYGVLDARSKIFRERFWTLNNPTPEQLTT